MTTEGEQIERFRLRVAFLRAIQALVPEVLQSLRSDVLPVFTNLFKLSRAGEPVKRTHCFYGISHPQSRGVIENFLSIEWRSPELHDPRGSGLPSWDSEFEGADLEAERIRFKDAFWMWASGFSLRDIWIRNEVLATLLRWLIQDKNRTNQWCLDSFRLSLRQIMDLPPTPRLQLDVQWDGEPIEEVKTLLSQDVSAFTSAIESYAKILHWHPDKAQEIARDCEWLALYQCRQKTPNFIREWQQKTHKESVTCSVVEIAIARVAKKVQITKRPSKRGPKGNLTF